jgi:hypothetical protein
VEETSEFLGVKLTIIGKLMIISKSTIIAIQDRLMRSGALTFS